MSYIRFSVVCLGIVSMLGFACTAAKNTGQAIGDGSKEVAEQVAGEVTDASITAAVKMKMADDPVVGAFDIDVDTEDGSVTLNGTVKNRSEASKAVQIAKSVEGVRNVSSNLVIGGS